MPSRNVTFVFTYLRVFTITCCLAVAKIAPVLAQPGSIDSLKALLQTQSHDSVRIDRLYALSIKLRTSAIKEAFAYASEAYQLSLDIQDTARIVKSAISVGIASNLMGNYKTVEELATKIEPLAEALNDEQSLGNVYLLRGRVAETEADYEKSINYFRKAIQHFEKSNHAGKDNGILDAWSRIAIAYRNIRSFKESIEAFKVALSIPTTETILARLKLNMANTYIESGDVKTFLQLNTEALEVFERVGNKQSSAVIYVNLGEAYALEKDYKQAMRFLRLAKKLFVEQGVKRGHSIAIKNIGDVYKELKQYDSAAIYYQQTLQLKKEINDQQGLAETQLAIGELWEAKGNNKKAMEYITTAVEAGKKLNSFKFQTAAGLTYGKLLAKMGNVEQAKKELETAYEIAKEKDLIREQQDISTFLSELLLQENNKDDAIKYLKAALAAKDSIAAKNRQDEIVRLEVDFKDRLAEQERRALIQENELKEAELQAQKLRQQNWIVSTGLVSFIAIITALFLFDRNRKNIKLKDLNDEISNQYEEIQRKNEEIQTQNEEIVTQNEQLRLHNETIHEQNEQLKAFRKIQQQIISKQDSDLKKASNQLVHRNGQLVEFSRITSHNIRGPLARMMGLANILRLNTIAANERELLHDKMSESAEELDRIVRQLNQVLDFSGDNVIAYSTVNLIELLHTVNSTLVDLYPRITWTLNTDDIVRRDIVADEQVLKSIFYFILDNSIRFRANRPLVIAVSSRLENNSVKIEIFDNGRGFDSEKFKERIFGLHERFQNDVRGEGMGLYLTKIQVEILGGSISINSEVDKGCQVNLSFPQTNE